MRISFLFYCFKLFSVMFLAFWVGAAVHCVGDFALPGTPTQKEQEHAPSVTTQPHNDPFDCPHVQGTDSWCVWHFGGDGYSAPVK